CNSIKDRKPLQAGERSTSVAASRASLAHRLQASAQSLLEEPSHPQRLIHVPTKRQRPVIRILPARELFGTQARSRLPSMALPNLSHIAPIAIQAWWLPAWLPGSIPIRHRRSRPPPMAAWSLLPARQAVQARTTRFLRPPRPTIRQTLVQLHLLHLLLEQC